MVRSTLLISALTLFLGRGALAAAYAFELVIFERPGGGSELNLTSTAPPDRSLASASIDAGALPASSRGLGPVAYTLSRKGMIVHKHVAWIQTPRSRNSRTWRWVDAGRLSGLVRVSRGRFLHLDADLLLRDPNRSTPHRVKVNRRFRSNELHYVDHPKVGILIRAKRLQAPAPAGSGPDAAAGEPKPAEPQGAQ